MPPSPVSMRSPPLTRASRPSRPPRTSRSFSLTHSRRTSYSSTYTAHLSARPLSLTDRAASLAAEAWKHGTRLLEKALAWFQTLTPLQKVGVALLCLLSATSSVLSLVYHAEIFAWLTGVARGWRDLPAGWVILFVFTMLVSCPPLIGYSTAVMLGGFVYDVPKGWYIVASGSTLGATLAFILYRHLLSSFVARLTQRDATFQALALTLKHDGFRLLVMIRLCPLPFSVTNAALSSIPTVSPLQFFLATAIASPKLFLHVWVGKQLADLADHGDKMDGMTKAVSYIGIALGSALGAGTGWWIWRQTQRRVKELRELEEEREAEEGGILLPDPEEFEEEDDDDDDEGDGHDEVDLGRRGSGDVQTALDVLDTRDEELASYHDESSGGEEAAVGVSLMGNGRSKANGDVMR